MMETYKLYRLYEQQRDKTLKQLTTLFDKKDVHVPTEHLVAIRFREQEHTWKDIFDKMNTLDVRQAMFTYPIMKELIRYFGVKRYSLSLDFTDSLPEGTSSLINGYLRRVQNEPNDLLRMEDLQQLISHLHVVSYEEDIDIKALCMFDSNESFQIFNNGIVKVSSREVLDHLVEVSYSRGW